MSESVLFSATNGALLAPGVGALLSSTALGRVHSLMYSFKPGTGQEQANAILGMRQPFQDIVNFSNTAIYSPVTLEDRGHIAKDGTIVSMPTDALINNLRTYAFANVNLGGMRDSPSTYNGRTLVFEVVSGDLGAGNTLGFQNAGAGAGTVVNATSTAYRFEKVITDVANISGELHGTVHFGGTEGQQSRLDALAALSNLKYIIYFKDLEAEAKDIANNPYKYWSLAFRQRLDHADVLRSLDYHVTMYNGATHLIDLAQLTDATWGAYVEPFAQNGPLDGDSHLRSQGIPTTAWLDLCENGSPSGNPWVAHLSLPGTLCMPFRKTCLSFWNASFLNYSQDGVALTHTLNDCHVWVDSAWLDLSSVTITTAPVKGTASYDTASGRLLYNPTSGGNPHTHTTGEQTELITLTGNTVVYDANNVASVGPSASFVIPYRVIEFSGGAGTNYLCRIDGGLVWPQNKTWMLDADRWRSNVREFVKTLVASGYSTTRELIIELFNESWNGALRFEFDKGFCSGVATALSAEWAAWQTAQGAAAVTQSFGGAGIVTALFRKYLEEELAAQALAYNIKWITSAQTAVVGYSSAMAQGHRFMLQDHFGLTTVDTDAKMATFGTAGTSYVSGVFADDALENLTGLAGQAHIDEVLDRFDGTKVGYATDSSTFVGDVVAWYTDNVPHFINNKWVADAHIAHKVAVEAEGGFWAWNYEGGDHNQDGNIPAGIFNSTRTNSLGQTFAERMLAEKSGASRATILQDMHDRMVSIDPTYLACQYGGLKPKVFGEPWGIGAADLPESAELLKIQSFGRLIV